MIISRYRDWLLVSWQGRIHCLRIRPGHSVADAGPPTDPASLLEFARFNLPDGSTVALTVRPTYEEPPD